MSRTPYRLKAVRAGLIDQFVEIYMFRRDEHGRVYLVTGELPEVEQSLIVSPAEATLAIPPEQAQTLMDELWDCGLRPTEGTGSAGALAATERHLRDMQRLVFDMGVAKR